MNKNFNICVENLNVNLKKLNHKKKLVNDISFAIRPGTCLGIMGQSGSGKTLIMKTLLGLLGESFEIAGKIKLQNQDIDLQDKQSLSMLRGRKISMVLQNPMNCFDPLYKISYQINETIQQYQKHSSTKLLTAEQLLLQVNIKDPQSVLECYPYELSGGMLQRIMIGISLLNSPAILIADEPTTAIDAINAKELMGLFKKIKTERDISLIFVSHDLSAIAEIADDVLVVADGKVIDQGSVDYLIKHSTVEQTRKMVDIKLDLFRKYLQLIRKGSRI